MRIALDAMGGDLGPEVTISGAAAFAKASGATVLLVGDPNHIEPLALQHDTDKLTIVPAMQTIDMDDHPVQAVRRKTDSSLVVAAKLVRQGKADAFVSAGNTGAAMAAAFLHMGRIPGIERPAIASPMPAKAGETIILDVGANVDCRPQHLLQFAGMGYAYMQKVRGISDPTIGLLNIGTEVSKGNELTTKTYKLLEDSGWNFVGNIEGREVFSGRANVIVCDGFVGNIVLKVAEGLAGLVLDTMMEEFASSKVTESVGLLARSAFQRLKQNLDYTEYGGAPLLGVDGVAIICHGSSDAMAIRNALSVAEDAVQAGLRDSIAETAIRLGGEK
jgi:glycerol-3-phosphate acyltransferase PlsX